MFVCRTWQYHEYTLCTLSVGVHALMLQISLVCGWYIQYVGAQTVHWNSGPKLNLVHFHHSSKIFRHSSQLFLGNKPHINLQLAAVSKHFGENNSACIKSQMFPSTLGGGSQKQSLKKSEYSAYIHQLTDARPQMNANFAVCLLV